MTYLPGDLLAKVDITSMACSLEARSPFLDHHVVELALRIPGEMRMRRLNGKAILKTAFRNMLPPQILRRAKMGFGVPIVEWLRDEIKDYARAQVLDGSASREFLDTTFLEEMWNQHQSGIRNYATELWGVLMLNLWHRLFAAGNGERPSVSPSVLAEAGRPTPR